MTPPAPCVTRPIPGGSEINVTFHILDIYETKSLTQKRSLL